MRPYSISKASPISSWIILGLRLKVSWLPDSGIEGQRGVIDLHRAIHRAVGLEGRAVGRVVLALPDDDRVLPALKHARAVRLVGEGGLPAGPGRRPGLRAYVVDLDLHDRADVGAVAGQRRRRAAGIAVVPVAGVVIIARVAGREGSRGVIVQDQRLAGVLREVDDHVMPLGRGGQQRVLVDVAGVEHGRVIDPGGRVGGDHDR